MEENMQRICLAVILLLGIVAFGFAGGQTHRQAAEEVLCLTRVDRMLKPLIDQVQQVQLDQLRQMDLSPEAYQSARRHLEKINALIARELQWQEIKDDYISLYTAAFTEEELHQLIGFYNTPVGRKVVEKRPVLMRQSMEIGRQQVMRIMPEIEMLSEEMVRDIRRRGK
jgi:hypothetical protein